LVKANIPPKTLKRYKTIMATTIERKISSDLPNIVYILNDHQAYYRHGWDSGPKVQRPYFDQLASEGISFERAYTACPLCGPARRTMLTGLFPHNHGEVKNDSNHPYEHEVYLDVLAENGYQNYYYGKWHAGPGTAYDHHCEGFSYPSYNNPYTKPEYKAYLEQENLPEPEILIERSFAHWLDVKPGDLYKQTRAWCNEHASGILKTPKETHEAFFLARLACEKLRELAQSDDNTPFALRVDFWGPHQPYFPTQEFADLYSPEEIPVYGNFNDTLEQKPEIYRSEANVPLNKDGKIIIPSPLPWSEWQKVLARCYAQITLVDAAGGMILNTLNELGLADNTLVIWTTDHGDGLACHGGHFDKRSYMPEEMVRIPFAMRWPEQIPPHQKSDKLVSNIDVAPTLLDAAGTGFNNSIDGRSLLSLSTGTVKEWRDDLMCETHGHMEDHIGRLIVTDQYKYVANEGQLDELYDLQHNPYELNNLINSSNHRTILADMQARLANWQHKTNDKGVK
jgi:arylsulfatase A-like enzyme